MTPDTENTLKQFKAAPLPAALTQRLIASAKAAQKEALLDRQTEEVLERFSPAPLTASQQARLDSALPRKANKKARKALLPALFNGVYRQAMARVAALALFVGVASLALYSALHMTPHDPNTSNDSNYLAMGQERSGIEHFAPHGYTKRDIISTEAGSDIEWKDKKAYQSYKVQYTNNLIVDLDDDTSIMISAPQVKKVSVQIETI